MEAHTIAVIAVTVIAAYVVLIELWIRRERARQQRHQSRLLRRRVHPYAPMINGYRELADKWREERDGERD